MHIGSKFENVGDVVGGAGVGMSVGTDVGAADGHSWEINTPEGSAHPAVWSAANTILTSIWRISPFCFDDSQSTLLTNAHDLPVHCAPDEMVVQCWSSENPMDENPADLPLGTRKKSSYPVQAEAEVKAGSDKKIDDMAKLLKIGKVSFL